MKRTGHVFQGRYKAIPVLDESYLMVLVKYIHLNPVGFASQKVCQSGTLKNHLSEHALGTRLSL